MANVMILGAHGQIATLVRQRLLRETQHHLNLFLRHAKRITDVDRQRETVYDGDVTDTDKLTKAMSGSDLVYANLGNSGIEDQAKSVVKAMDANHIKRLIWISTLGIYDEVPGAFGRWNHKMLDGGYLETYAAAANVIENSDLAYTIIRPAWLSNKAIVSYELTQKGEPFKGTEVSRSSIADLVVNLINHPRQHIGESLGVDQPHTQGDKPSFY
ncbi:SDR family oxidoreductase [Lacticaseibacillus rhamnosus]|uniref:SDR family oxidoreductase n=1 Tax=Lacticaseibacillus rhamnosus TaxID=47715 RepID=UPI00065AA445|nr:SDR family oxidoreductase [Lacticaseibacillus rhamnosus]KMO46461.1 NAD-dependent dehydratase [Lacticaseibacillus rhamnosus]OAU00336.1 NAD-dependent dehydratase [Lacticaseibacillus rhamnosus]